MKITFVQDRRTNLPLLVVNDFTANETMKGSKLEFDSYVFSQLVSLCVLMTHEEWNEVPSILSEVVFVYARHSFL